jgi:hypothetical protein
MFQTQTDGGRLENTGTANLTDCTTSGSSAAFGGGLQNGYGGTLTLNNCTIPSNSSSNDGAGLDNVSNSAGRSAMFTDCTISGNSAADRSGGLFSYESATTLINSKISRNSAANGGCMYNSGCRYPAGIDASLAQENGPADGDATGPGPPALPRRYRGRTGPSGVKTPVSAANRAVRISPAARHSPRGSSGSSSRGDLSLVSVGDEMAAGPSGRHVTTQFFESMGRPWSGAAGSGSSLTVRQRTISFD